MTKELEDEVKKIQEELAGLAAEDEGDDSDEIEAVADEVVEETESQKEESEDSAKEKEPVAEAKPEEEKLDNAGYARLRREAQAEKRRADDLERQISELKNRSVEAAESVEQEQAAIPLELQQVIENERYNQAEKVVVRLENEFKQTAPDDYDDVALQYKTMVYNSIRITNPDLSHGELLDGTRKRLLELAAQHKQAGYNPVEKMYLDGKKMGFSALPKQKEAAVEKESPKPDLDKIAANKKRNAGTAGAKGAGDRGQMTAEVLADLPVSEYMKIPVSERKRIMETLR